MKTDWKWNFAAQFGLLAIMAVAAFMIGSAFVFVVPIVVKSHVDLGITLPNYLIQSISVADLIHHTIWFWLIALAGGVALFEWKCRSENKTLIRLVAGVASSLVLVALAFWVAAAVVIPLVQARHAAMDQQNESVVIARILEAHESYQQLAQAIEEEDWQAADDPATEVRDAYRFLRDMGTARVVLANESELGSSAEIHRLTAEIADFSDELHDAIRDNKDRSVTLEYFSQLKETYSQLETKSKFFATHLATLRQVTEAETSRRAATTEQ